MERDKKGSELLAEVYRNTHYAIASISDILPETEEGALREEIKRMHEGYERIGGRAAQIAKERGVRLREPNPVKRAMMWGGVKLNAMKDGSEEHIAQMLTQGTVMGITSLFRSIGEAKDDAERDVLELAGDLLAMEQDYEQALKKYLC